MDLQFRFSAQLNIGTFEIPEAQQKKDEHACNEHGKMVMRSFKFKGI